MGHVIDFLQGLGNVATFALVTGTLVGAAFLLPRLRHHLHIEVRKEVNDGASDAYKAVISSVIFILAFALYQVQANYRDAEQLVQKEAGQINVLERQLSRLDVPEAKSLETQIEDYAELVIDKDWPAMQLRQQRSPDVDAAYNKLISAIRALPSAKAGEPLRTADDLGDTRNARFAMVDKALPTLYWVMVLGLLAVLLVLAVFTQASFDRELAHAGLMCAVGLLLSLVIIIDGPFKGETSVGPDAIVRIHNVIVAR